MKKRKSLHLRKIRKRSHNKSLRFSFLEFPQIFNFYFYKVFLKKKKLLYSFMLSFYCVSHDKIQNFLKKFGMLYNFRIKVARIKKKLNKRLKIKFNKKYNIDYKIRRRKTAIFKIFFLKKFKGHDRSVVDKKHENVENKKRLRLHFSYRHLLSLPVRGQRTKTNAKTRKNYNIV